jgi:hypothetical protein
MTLEKAIDDIDHFVKMYATFERCQAWNFIRAALAESTNSSHNSESAPLLAHTFVEKQFYCVKCGKYFFNMVHVC